MTSEQETVVVVGAGLGGLASAAFLSQAGYRVCVFERHDRAGGYASSFRRGSYNFEVSLHLMDAIAPGKPNHYLFEELGVADSVDLMAPNPLRREIWGPHDIRIPAGMDDYLALFGSLFPDERRGLKRVADLAAKTHEAFHAVRSTESQYPAVATALARRSAASVIRSEVDDPLLLAMLDRFAIGWLGAPLTELSAAYFLVPWFSYHQFGGCYPKGGSQALSNALCRTIQSNGGEVHLSMPVDRIRLERHKIAAVRLANGDEIPTRFVISNTNPHHTFFDLLEPDDVEPRLRDRVRRLEPSCSCVKAWLGLSEVPDGIHKVGYDVTLGVDDVDRSNKTAAEQAPLSVVVPGNLSRSLVPENRAIVTITMSLEPHAEPQVNGEELLAQLLHRVERRLIPGLRRSIDTSIVATPRTFQRFTGNPAGAIYGAHPSYRHPRLGHTTAITGLFLAGAWTQPGAGFTSVLRSGIDAARSLMGPRRPGKRPS